jgi:23S rRNA (cytidine2498-2'-O)-methyltransferase
MHLFLSAPEMAVFLREELARMFPGAPVEAVGDALISVKPATEGAFGPVVFSRQCLPSARSFAVPSIRIAAETLVTDLIGRLPDGGPWRLHVEPCFGSGDAGRHRCQLIHEAVIAQLRQRRRSLLRSLAKPAAASGGEIETPPKPFSADESFVQLLLTSPEMGFLSVLAAPAPAQFAGSVSPFPKGDIPVAVDKSAPSRAFAKLAETELRMGRFITSGETCVDLGASPGSWTYMPVKRGARVIAVDRSPLRDDLMRSPLVTFHQGDAFKFVPPAPVDWLLCDVIAAPERSIGLVLDWVRERRCRHFIVTIKFKGQDEYAKLDVLKQELPAIAANFQVLHLCANKNEACVFGTVAGG